MPSVAVLGTRGYPSYYGGFETAIRHIAPELANMGWEVTVYSRTGRTGVAEQSADPRVIRRSTPGLETRSLSTLSYGASSTFDASVRRPDVALVMNCANGFFLPLLKARGIPTLVNVDGLEWERDKWGPTAKRVFRAAAKCTARWATSFVFDARAIEAYWHQTFNVRGTFIPYGGDMPPALAVPEAQQHRGYVLMVARFVPENSVREFFEAVPAIAAELPVVMVGSTGYGGEFDDLARRLAADHSSVTWLGHVSNDRQLHALWQHAAASIRSESSSGCSRYLDSKADRGGS